MPEMRFAEFPVFPIDLRIGISRSASEIADCLFFLPNIRNIVVFIIIFLKGENLRHNHLLITVNIFSIKKNNLRPGKKISYISGITRPISML